MRILIVTQYFWPESFVVNDLVRWLTKAGHSVTVATGKPNYPTGELAPGYTRDKVQYETFAGTQVFRIPSRPRHQATALNLALNYLSFAWSGLLWFPRLLKRHEFDVILVLAMPITAALPAILLRWLKRCHLALWVQDLWPQVVTSTGFVDSRLVVATLHVLVKFIYRAADTVLVQSNQFVGPIAKMIPKKKIFVLPNFAPPSDEEALPLPLAIAGLFPRRFSVVFAGNLGRAQSLSTIVHAARILRLHPDILIVVAGTGSHAETLREAVTAAKLTNVQMIGMLDRRMMPELFRHADCLLVTLGNHPALNATIPSKIQAYMKAGRPIVGAVNGAAADLIERAGVGLTGQAEDGAGLAQNIIALTKMPAIKRQEMGRAGRAYYEKHFDADQVLSRLLGILQREMSCHA
ncbi:glycosyltransferase family 4 protein [Bradyrhizobium sp. CB82]|uniref:glycosyltransferase family 4 protein n=1 Tax=Bradyrhizobium sp. CB82 TaxID=3039159 RepID=UPI0024B0A3A3|nr:glycosyltransferase family 4 protein [Bradyrhizobium sp. CB82]WFU37352.1 glycosyltransferase family 4 protein [Bradyrhizobium sp. CB82]